MKRFKFRLQPLLNYKIYQEQIARQEMAKAVADVNACRQRINTLEQERVVALEKVDRLVEKGIGAREFSLHQGFIGATERAINDEIARKDALKRKVDEKRRLLKKKTIDKKGLERLQKMQKEAHTAEMIREEQKELDEVASLRTAREVANG